MKASFLPANFAYQPTVMRNLAESQLDKKMEKPMIKYQKIITLENEIEARLLASILDQENISYLLKSYHDSAYDGLWQMQKGWGYIEAPKNFKGKIISVYQDIKEKK